MVCDPENEMPEEIFQLLLILGLKWDRHSTWAKSIFTEKSENKFLGELPMARKPGFQFDSAPFSVWADENG